MIRCLTASTQGRSPGSDSRVVKSPMTLGAFALSSSAESGFCFWGMMLEPEVKGSLSWQNENSVLDQITSSDPMRERWVRQIDPAER